jgi:hypothetical protein
MSDVEKYNAKDEFLKAFEEMRPDFFIPEMYENKKDQEHVAAMLRPAQTRTAMFASIPMRCRGAKCAFADVCPLQLENKAPVGKKCPFEMAMVADFMHSLMDELHVRPDNLIEVAMVRDLVNQEVQQIRVSNRLSLDDFIQENVVGIDPEGNPVLKKELHQAVELEDRILKRKKELRNQLMATREKKAQIGERSKDDSNVISNLLEQIREVDILNQTKLQKELGTYGLDDYIESHVVEEKTAIEEGD